MIDTQEIRKKILSLALTGKLVEQNSSDTPAHQLVESLSGSLNNHPFENDISAQEIPYEIPDSWVWCRLSDIGTTNIGLTYHPQDVAEDGTIVIRSSNIIKGKMDYADLVKVKCQIRENQYLKRNDIVICARNGSKALVGKCAIYEGDSDVISFGAFMAIFRTPFFQYAYLYFNSPVFRRNFSNDDSKQINQVTQNILKNSLIPIPPEEEQKRITDKINSVFSFLDTIDTLQSQYQENLATLKSKIIDAGIQGKLTEQLPEDGTAEELYQQIQREKLALEKAGKIKKSKPFPPISDEEKPFDIPDNWKWVRLADVYEINPKVNADDNINAAFIPMERISAGFDRSFSYVVQKWSEASKNHTRFCDGDVAFAKISPCFENRKSFVVENLPNSLGGGTTELIILRQKLIDPLFTYYLILDERFIRLGLSTYKGTVGQQRIKNDVMFAYVFPLPPLAEQKRIVAKLEELLPLCEGK